MGRLLKHSWHSTVVSARQERARELQAGTQYHKAQAGGALSAIAADIKGLAHLGGSKQKHAEADSSPAVSRVLTDGPQRLFWSLLLRNMTQLVLSC